MRVFKWLVAPLALAGAALPSHAVTYEVRTQGNYTTIVDAPAVCGAGSCSNFNASMRPGGRFHLVAPIPANFSGDIGAQVTGFSFSNGIDTFASTDGLSGIWSLFVATNSSGVITSFGLSIKRWQVPGLHGTGSHFDEVNISSNGGGVGTHNTHCLFVGPSPVTGVPDMCTNFVGGHANESRAFDTGPATAGIPVTMTPIPTLSEYGLILLASLLGMFSLSKLRRAAPRTSHGRV